MRLGPFAQKTVWSKPRREAENRGAGQQGGVGLGVPTPRPETEAGAVVFRLAEPVFRANGPRRIHVQEEASTNRYPISATR